MGAAPLRVEAARLIDGVDVAIVVLSRGGIIACANEAATAAFGLPPGEVVGTDVGALQCWEEGGSAGAALQAAVSAAFSGCPTRLDLHLRGSSIEILDARLRLVSDGRPSDAVVVLTGVDVTEERRTRAELQRRRASPSRIPEAAPTDRSLDPSERRLADAQRIGRLGHWEWDVAEDTVRWSDETYRIFGLYRGAFEPTYAGFLERVHPEDRDFVASAVERTLAVDSPYSIDHRIIRPGGEVAFVHNTGSVTRNEAGASARMLGTIQDITERKITEDELRRSVEEKSVLLREVHHRVKNNLQVVSSLLYLQSSSAPDPRLEAMLDESRRRIRAMALIHELLYMSNDMRGIPMREYVIRLVTALLGSFSELQGRVDVETHVADVSLEIERAIPCGLIINELVTNSLKYAFRGRENGKIQVFVHRDGDQCAVQVSDDGIGLPADADLDAPASLGLRLVRTLAEQLDARLTIRRAPGASFSFRFVCPQPGARSGS